VSEEVEIQRVEIRGPFVYAKALGISEQVRSFIAITIVITITITLSLSKYLKRRHARWRMVLLLMIRSASFYTSHNSCIRRFLLFYHSWGATDVLADKDC
jgi:hypothetical protein